jgi:hypothetical protein
VLPEHLPSLPPAGETEHRGIQVAALTQYTYEAFLEVEPFSGFWLFFRDKLRGFGFILSIRFKTSSRSLLRFVFVNRNL